MCLRRAGNPAFQSLNFQGMGVTPWMQMQPRFDTQMLGLQSDMYQTAAAAALHETRSMDTTKHAPPQMLHFQQTPNTTSRSSPILASQVLQTGQPQLPQTFHQNIQINQVLGPSQSEFFQHQLPQVYSLGEQQQPQQILQQQIPEQQQILHHQQLQQKKLLPNHEQISGVPSFPQLMSELQSPSAALQNVSPFSQPQNFADSNSNSASTSAVSPLHNILHQLSPEAASNLLAWARSNQVTTSRPTQWSSKRLAVETMLPLPAGDQSVMPQVEQLGVTQTSLSQHSVALPPFPGRECMMDQDGNVETQSHHLFGVNIDSSSLLVQNGMTALSNASAGTDSLNMHYDASNFVGSSGNDFSLNHSLSGSHGDEPGYFPSPENTDPINAKGGTFVKICKSGSYGRSLDITRFSSYHELRRELERLFGLEGQLEDPLRSGWQLVFVDREDDILLVGDDPWQEFVSNVSCIQILSPQEVQQMGKQTTNFLNSAPAKRLPPNSCDDYMKHQDSRNLSTTTRIASVGSLKY